MRFAYLHDFPEHLSRVANWIYGEFAHEFKTLTLENWTEQLQLSQTKGVTTIIALRA